MLLEKLFFRYLNDLNFRFGINKFFRAKKCRYHRFTHKMKRAAENTSAKDARQDFRGCNACPSISIARCNSMQIFLPSLLGNSKICIYRRLPMFSFLSPFPPFPYIHTVSCKSRVGTWSSRSFTFARFLVEVQWVVIAYSCYIQGASTAHSQWT